MTARFRCRSCAVREANHGLPFTPTRLILLSRRSFRCRRRRCRARTPMPSRRRSSQIQQQGTQVQATGDRRAAQRRTPVTRGRTELLVRLPRAAAAARRRHAAAGHHRRPGQGGGPGDRRSRGDRQAPQQRRHVRSVELSRRPRAGHRQRRPAHAERPRPIRAAERRQSPACRCRRRCCRSWSATTRGRPSIPNGISLDEAFELPANIDRSRSGRGRRSSFSSSSAQRSVHSAATVNVDASSRAGRVMCTASIVPLRD